MTHSRVHFLPLCWSFFKIGAGAFGGGIAALPVFEAELVNRRHWLTPAEVAEAYAICQSIPGVIIINFAVFTGLRLTGKRGAILAAIAVAIPSFLIILALATVIGGHWHNRWIAAALSGLRPAVIAIVVGAAYRLGRRSFHSFLPWIAAAVGGGLMFAGWITPIALILIGAAIGFSLFLFRPKHNEETP